jgi:hypothetical protein
MVGRAVVLSDCIVISVAMVFQSSDKLCVCNSRTQLQRNNSYC